MSPRRSSDVLGRRAQFRAIGHAGRRVNPLVVQGKPTVTVNTQKARDLLIAGVNAIRN